MGLRYGLYGKEENAKEIADMMNISQSYISRLKKDFGKTKKDFQKCE